MICVFPLCPVQKGTDTRAILQYRTGLQKMRIFVLSTIKIPHLARRGQEVGAELVKNSERLKERLGRNFRLYYFNLNEVLSNER